MAGTSGSRLPPLTIRGVNTFAVEVPMTYPLGTSAAIVRSAPLLLVDLETEEGITGRTYLFCYRASVPRAIDAVLRDAVSVVEGEPAAPLEVAAKLARRFALVGVASVVRMALSALDVAMWDALAVAAGLPLATLLGARPRPIPAYNSNGLGLMSPDAAADEAEKLLAGGFRSVKLRLGHPTLEQDLAVTRAVRKRLPDAIELAGRLQPGADRRGGHPPRTRARVGRHCLARRADPSRRLRRQRGRREGARRASADRGELQRSRGDGRGARRRRPATT